MKYQIRKRIKSDDIIYSLHLYFSSDLSLRNTSKALFKYIQRYSKKPSYSNKGLLDFKMQTKMSNLYEDKYSEFIIDETQIKVGSEFI